jgi:hypothetical protein
MTHIIDAERVRRLQAAALHDAMPETSAIEVTHHPEDGVGTLLETPHFVAQIQPHVRTGEPALSINSIYNSTYGMTLDRVDELIALLQRSRAEMAGGG